MSTILPPPASRLRRAAGAFLRSPAGAVLDRLAWPHGLDRYLELVDPMLARDAQRALVTDVRRETADTTTLTLRPNRWAGHRAGQHLVVTVELDGRRHTRCYSVSSSAHRDDGQLSITVKADPRGQVSPFLAHTARPGLVLDVSEARGEFLLPDVRPGRLLLVSAGSGITPVMSMARTLVDEDAECEITFLHYARTEADVPFRDELHALAARTPTLRVVEVLTRRPPSAATGPLTGHLSAAHVETLIGGPGAVPAYVCGPPGLLEAASQLWTDAGALEQLHVERFRLDPATVDEDAGGTVTLAATGRRLDNDGRSLLEQAEAAGLTPDRGCRMGICHTYIRPKLAGRVRDLRDGRVSSSDPEDIQLCISTPVGDVTIDL